MDASVVIAGAGPVGLSLAIGLSRCGVKAVVLEKKPELSEHSKAVVILPRTLQAFESWDLLGRFLENSEFLRTVQPVDAHTNKPLIQISFDAIGDVTPLGGLMVLPQDRTERILLQAAKEAGVDVRFANELTGFVQDDEGVTVTAQGPTGAFSLRTHYLVGCDGAHSRVRDVLDLHLGGKTYPVRVVLADMDLLDERDCLPWPRIDTNSEGLLFAVRFAENHWRIIDGAGADTQQNLDDRIKTDVEKLFGPGPFRTIWKSDFRIHERVTRSFHLGKVLLAGDAAHLNSPAGGQGMNGGIQDAHNLAWKLARALSGGDETALLDSFTQERRHAIVSTLHPLTDRLTGLMLQSKAERRGLMVKGLGLAMNLPAVQHKAALAMGMLQTTYPESDLIVRGPAYVGEIMPDMALQEGEKVRYLYEWLYPEAVLALFDHCEDNPWPQLDLGDQVRILRIVRPKTRTSGQFLRTATDEQWWRFGTLETRAVLVRPDGYIGWQQRAPDFDLLRNSVAKALGNP